MFSEKKILPENSELFRSRGGKDFFINSSV
jgi:hypothetical protein